jgi:hypothetical protein
MWGIVNYSKYGGQKQQILSYLLQEKEGVSSFNDAAR